MFSKKASKFDKIFTNDLTLTTLCQINGEDFVNFCGLLRRYELYYAIKESVGKDRLFLDLQLTAEDTNLGNHMICQLLSLQFISLIVRQQL